MSWLNKRSLDSHEPQQQAAAHNPTPAPAPAPASNAAEPPLPRRCAAQGRSCSPRSRRCGSQVSEKGGETLFEGMLQPGQTYAVPSTATAPVLKTGKPEALKVTVGTPVAPPGRSAGDNGVERQPASGCRPDEGPATISCASASVPRASGVRRPARLAPAPARRTRRQPTRPIGFIGAQGALPHSDVRTAKRGEKFVKSRLITALAASAALSLAASAGACTAAGAADAGAAHRPAREAGSADAAAGFPKGRPADTAGFSDDPAATQSSVVSLDQRLDALEKQMADLVRQSEENGNRLRSLETGIGQLKNDQDQRIAAIEQRLAEAAAAPPVQTPKSPPAATSTAKQGRTPVQNRSDQEDCRRSAPAEGGAAGRTRPRRAIRARTPTPRASISGRPASTTRRSAR